MRWLILSLVSGGCIPLIGLQGAQPVPKKQVDLQAAAVIQTNSGDFSGTSRPHPVGGVRVGLGGDTDLGIRLFGLGGGLDVRHRFIEHKRLHFAVIPGVDVAYEGESDFIITDFKAPFVLEWAAGKNISLIVDTRLVLREYWLAYKHPMGPGQFNRTELFWGGGGRFDWHPKRFRLGLGLEMFHQPIDGGKPAVSMGLDLGFRLGKHPKRSTQTD